MESDDVIAFCQSDLLSTSFAVFQDMRKTGDLCDLTINVQNRSLLAHRVILAAGIPYFRTLFASSEVKIEEREISLEDLDPGVLESLIDFAYSSRVNISIENVQSLLRASKFLQLDEVFDACVEFLSTKLHFNNILEVRALALSLNNSHLIQGSNHFIRQNFKEFSRSDDFLSLPHSFVKEIIADDDLNAPSEEVVFEAVINWVKNSPSERRVALPELLSEVRMIYLPTDYLIERVSSEELIRTSMPCRDQLDEVKNYHLIKKMPALSNLKTEHRKCKNTWGGIYAVCHNDATCEHVIYYCDFVNETWHNVASIVQKDACIHKVAVANEKIYMFLEERIQTFHLKTLEWELLQPRHRDISAACVLSHENIIYCFGSHDDSFLGKVRCFDTLQNNWMEERIMRTPRWGAAAVSCKESIFVTGGCSGSKCFDTVEKYNPSTGQWGEVAPMLTARKCHGCIATNGKIYACGGWTNSDWSCTAEMYNPLSNQWNFISPMKIERYYASLIYHNGKTYALGGSASDGTYTLEVEMYDPESDQWRSGFNAPYGFKCAVSVPIDCKLRRI